MARLPAGMTRRKNGTLQLQFNVEGKRYTVIESRENVVQSQTIRTYKKIMNRVLGTVIDKAGHTFGDLKLVKVEPDNVRALQKELQKECSIKDKNGKERGD